MARFNRFGALYTQVLTLYPGTVVADYDAGGANGITNIQSVMDRITREIASALTPAVYLQMTQVDAEQIVRYATAGQTTATLGLLPALASTTHLWVYPNPALLGRNASDTGGISDAFYRKPAKGVNALTGWAVTVATGAITGITALSAGERVYASYDVDSDSASFSMASMQDVLLLGCAAEVGSWLYSEGTQEWKAVTEYRDRFAKWMERIVAGEWVPDELRKLTYYEDVERKSGEVKSVRWYRG